MSNPSCFNETQLKNPTSAKLSWCFSADCWRSPTTQVLDVYLCAQPFWNRCSLVYPSNYINMKPPEWFTRSKKIAIHYTHIVIFCSMSIRLGVRFVFRVCSGFFRMYVERAQHPFFPPSLLPCFLASLLPCFRASFLPPSVPPFLPSFLASFFLFL